MASGAYTAGEPVLDENSAAPLLRKFWQQCLAFIRKAATSELDAQARWRARKRASARTTTYIDSDSDNAAWDRDPGSVDGTLEKALEAMKVLAKESFERHDTNGDGVLDKGEAAVFFKHVVEELSNAWENGAFGLALISTCMRELKLKLHMSLLEVVDGPELTGDDIREKANQLFEEIRLKVPELADEQFLHIKECIHTLVARAVLKCKRFRTLSERERAEKHAKWERNLMALNPDENALVKEVDAKREDYIANKEERDAAAFAFLDENNDGTIAISDVLDALVPGNDPSEFHDFYEILGVLVFEIE